MGRKWGGVCAFWAHLAKVDHGDGMVHYTAMIAIINARGCTRAHINRIEWAPQKGIAGTIIYIAWARYKRFYLAYVDASFYGVLTLGNYIKNICLFGE